METRSFPLRLSYRHPHSQDLTISYSSGSQGFPGIYRSLLDFKVFRRLHVEDLRCSLKNYLHLRFPQVLLASVKGPDSTPLDADGVTGSYRSELKDRPATYTSGFF
jgi:hypothetical protein